MTWTREAPEHKTIAQLAAMTLMERSEYNDERFDWLYSDAPIKTTHTDKLERIARTRVRAARGRSAVAGGGIAISGQAGVGKSTAAIEIGRAHDRDSRQRYGNDQDYAPVVYIVVDPDCTPKALMRKFAVYLGAPFSERDTAQRIADIVVHVLRQKRTNLIIVDEVHNLASNRAGGSSAANTLKVFSERLQAAVIYCGIGLDRNPLFEGELGSQIGGRVAMYHLTPFGNGSREQRNEWASVVLGLEKMLPLANHELRSLLPHANYLFDRTAGSIGSLRRLLADAASAAIDDGTERLDRAHLDAALVDFAATSARDKQAVAHA